MKKYILFLIFCLFAIDSFAAPKSNRGHQSRPAKTSEPLPDSDKSMSNNSIVHSYQNGAELDTEQPVNSQRNSPKEVESHESTTQRSPTTKEEESLAVTPNDDHSDWIVTQPEAVAAEETPFRDFFKKWQMWFKATVQDPKLQDRLKRFFNLTKTYEIFSEELAQCPEERRQEAFDDLIKVFNTPDAPLFGYELLSEAITQAINDRQETKLHQLTDCAISHKKHLPPAILEAAEKFLTQRNEAEASSVAAEVATTLAMIHRRADTIKKIQRPTSPLAPLTDNQSQEIANEQISQAIQNATRGFVKPKSLERK